MILFYIEKFLNKIWYEKKNFLNLIFFLMIPLSLIYLILFEINKLISQKKRFKTNIVCVGNCNIGGAGKTSTILSLIKIYEKKYTNIVVLLKGYKGKIKQPMKVDIKNHFSKDVGDEALLYAEHINTFISNDRLLGIKEIISKEKPDLIILDDGYQHFRIKKNKNILIINSDLGFGNGMLLPAGPLRELPSNAIQRSDIIILIGEPNEKMNRILGGNKKLVRANILAKENLSNNKFFAFSGIGNNESFLKTLKLKNYNFTMNKSFPDHYFYTQRDIDNIKDLSLKNELTPITTEKDIKRLSASQKDGIEVLKINIDFENKEKIKTILF